MTIRPPLVSQAQSGATHPRQIRPITVWTTLTQAQQTAVLQEVVTMCQECLLHPEEVSHDALATLTENHANPS
jgi:hypothetical protein